MDSRVPSEGESCGRKVRSLGRSLFGNLHRGHTRSSRLRCKRTRASRIFFVGGVSPSRYEARGRAAEKSGGGRCGFFSQRS
jgi:hypothetical protein